MTEQQLEEIQKINILQIVGGISIKHLQKLVKADKMVGKQLWFIKWFSPEVKFVNPPISRVVIGFSCLRDKTILLQLKDGAVPVELIGDVVFETKEAAEAALTKKLECNKT